MDGIKIKVIAAAVALLLICIPAFSQSAESEGTSAGVDLGIGVQTFQEPNPDYDPTDPDSEKFISVAYQSLNLSPDFGFGKFGIGFDIIINYRFTGGDTGNEFEVREEDWVVEDFEEFLEVYLPMIKYVRYGWKGNPLFIKFGSIDDAVLGNGFIMGNYSNTQYLPDQRIFGLSFDLDGALFNFPFVGIETFVSNLAAFDVFGTRLYVRPLILMDVPIVKNLQIGATMVADNDPLYFGDPLADDLGAITKSNPSVVVGGIDFRLPIVSKQMATLATFGDFVVQNESTGGMLGFGGRLIKFVTYGAQLRILGDNFIPVYFDQVYDLYRPLKYRIINQELGTAMEGYVGWFLSTGFSLVNDQIVFNASLDGPFGGGSDNAEDSFKNPHFKAVFVIEEGLLPSFYFDAVYDKKNIRNFKDLIDPENAVIKARLNYKSGPAVLSLVYNLRYDPANEPDPWEVTSGLESTISLY